MPLPNTDGPAILDGPGPSQHYVFIKHFVLIKSINKMIIYKHQLRKKNKRQTALENEQIMTKMDESN